MSAILQVTQRLQQNSLQAVSSCFTSTCMESSSRVSEAKSLILGGTVAHNWCNTDRASSARSDSHRASRKSSYPSSILAGRGEEPSGKQEMGRKKMNPRTMSLHYRQLVIGKLLHCCIVLRVDIHHVAVHQVRQRLGRLMSGTGPLVHEILLTARQNVGLGVLFGERSTVVA